MLLLLGCGNLGLLTFQVPFGVYLLPQLQVSFRLQTGLSYVEIQSSNGTIFPVDCPHVDSLVTMPKCFDPMFNSYGNCVGEIQTEYYKVYGRLYASGWEQGSMVPVSDSEWLNRFAEDSNPSMLSSARYWCEQLTRLYDPKGTHPPYPLDNYYFNSRSEAFDFVGWFFTSCWADFLDC